MSKGILLNIKRESNKIAVKYSIDFDKSRELVWDVADEIDFHAWIWSVVKSIIGEGEQ
jgi:hypothetical protein